MRRISHEANFYGPEFSPAINFTTRRAAKAKDKNDSARPSLRKCTGFRIGRRIFLQEVWTMEWGLIVQMFNW